MMEQIENLKEITLKEMRERIEELRNMGITDLEYKNMRYLAYDFIPNNKCKSCKKNPIRILEGSTNFITLFTCKECDIKKEKSKTAVWSDTGSILGD